MSRHHNVFIITGFVLQNCPDQGFFDESQKKNRNKGRKINSYRHWRKYLLNGPDDGIGDGHARARKVGGCASKVPNNNRASIGALSPFAFLRACD